MIKLRRHWTDIYHDQQSQNEESAEQLHRCYKQFEKGLVGEEEFLSLFFSCSKHLFSSRIEAAEYYSSIIDDEYPGVQQLVEKLQDLKFHTGCLSNTNAVHHRIFSNEGKYPAYSSLRTKIFSFKENCMKPDRRVYEAFERSSGFSGKDIVFFDDKKENVQAAIDFGWHAFLIDPEADTSEQMHTLLTQIGVLPCNHSCC